MEERTKYASFWQSKLRDNDDIEFPDVLCRAIAGITDDFSFAYMQEAFVASLLAIAARDEARDDGAVATAANDDLERFELWREMKYQVRILRDEL
jgi:transitional endoplasmic reticulum ATPase